MVSRDVIDGPGIGMGTKERPTKVFKNIMDALI